MTMGPILWSSRGPSLTCAGLGKSLWHRQQTRLPGVAHPFRVLDENCSFLILRPRYAAISVDRSPKGPRASQQLGKKAGFNIEIFSGDTRCVGLYCRFVVARHAETFRKHRKPLSTSHTGRRALPPPSVLSLDRQVCQH